MLFQTSLGVDIQDKAVSIVYLSGSFKGSRLRAHAVYPLSDYESIEQKMELVEGVVKEFIRAHRISPVTVFLGVPRNLAVLRYVELPLAVKENLEESVGYQMEKYVPFSIEELYFDCQVIRESKDIGNIRVLLIAVKKTAVEPYLSLADKLGLRLSGIEISSTAVANYVLSLPDLKDEDCCALVYLNEEYFEFGLLRSGFLDYSKRIEGETLKSNPTEVLGRELKNLKAVMGPQDHDLKTLIFGSKADLPPALEEMEGLDIHMRDSSEFGLASPELIPAYGLAAKGIMKLSMKTNILPERFRKRPNRTGQYIMFGLAGLLILSLLAWGGGKIVSGQLYLQRLNTELEQLSVEVAKIEKMKARVSRVADHIDFLNSFYTNDVSVLEVLKELSTRIPKSAWIQRLTFADRELRIDGLASSSSELIPLLDASSIFEDVSFVSSITRDKQGRDRFRIKLKVRDSN